MLQGEAKWANTETGRFKSSGKVDNIIKISIIETFQWSQKSSEKVRFGSEITPSLFDIFIPIEQ
jgi:hypothetical protein